MLDIRTIPLMEDNYAYLVRDTETSKVAVVDPSVAAGVASHLKQLDWSLDYILNTHHHYDHVGGNLELKESFGAKVVGFEGDSDRIPGLDIGLKQNDSFPLGRSKATILKAPGHTNGHILFWFSEAQALFSGDTLFSLGCGRLFEGTAGQMWESLKRLTELPGSTRLYCGHEYTEANAAFALTVDPSNVQLLEKSRRIKQQRQKNEPTVPSTLDEEFACNPFLRSGDMEIKKNLQMEQASDAAVFAEIRRRKDAF